MKKATIRPTAIPQSSFRLSRPDRAIVENRFTLPVSRPVILVKSAEAQLPCGKKSVCVCVCVSRASILTLQVLEESLCGAGAGRGGERGCADLGRTALCRITASG